MAEPIPIPDPGLPQLPGPIYADVETEIDGEQPVPAADVRGVYEVEQLRRIVKLLTAGLDVNKELVQQVAELKMVQAVAAGVPVADSEATESPLDVAVRQADATERLATAAEAVVPQLQAIASAIQANGTALGGIAADTSASRSSLSSIEDDAFASRGHLSAIETNTAPSP